MKAWLIQTGEDIPFDENIRKLRTAVLAENLIGRGHEVTWWASSFSHLKKNWIDYREERLQLESGIQVELLKGRGYKSNVSLARLIDHRVVAKLFRDRALKAEKPDIVVSALPPHDLAYEAATYTRERGIPLIVDARDSWPDIFVDLVPRLLRPLGRAVLRSEFRLTQHALREADSITAMSEDMMSWALSYCDRERQPTDRVFHLGFQRASAEPVEAPDWLTALDGRFIVAFIGTFTNYHSPLTLVRAARHLLSEGRCDIAIVIAGAGGDIEAQVKTEASGLSNVVMPGWLNKAGINALLDRAAVGICPTSADARFFPNKTFLYFSRGLPVLSAFQGELRRVLEQDGLGRYFNHPDAGALAQHIKMLCDRADIYAQMQANVRKAFARHYDEEVIYSAFADHIEQVAEAADA